MKIIADSISVSYNKKGNTVKVLDKVDISFENGKLTLITGRSGSGKTTLINVLSGILAPNDGQVYYDDTSVYMQSDEQLSAFRCENIGYIPQGASALSSLTVLQNVLLPSVLSGNDDTVYAKQLLDILGLKKQENAYPDELSGGELRRLSVARALINSPSVIFADEPTNDLDEENATLILKLLKDQAERGAAVIAVTHDSSALAYADKVYEMNSGSLIGKERENETTICRPLVS